MRMTTLGLMIAGLTAAGTERSSPSQEAATILGVVRVAGTGEPIANAAVFVGLEVDSVRTDSTGRFALRAARGASVLGVRKDGYLAFQYPMLRLATDTLRVEIELRTDPPGRESYATATNLFYLCITIDAPDRLAVHNSCGSLRFSPSAYSRRIIKHNPWNPYFGPAGDRGGVLIATRVVPSAATR